MPIRCVKYALAGRMAHGAQFVMPQVPASMYRASVNDPPDDSTLFVPRYLSLRALTERLAAPLGAEDQCVQSMPDASPTKWHLAHTTWFFETLVLMPHARDYEPYDPRFHYLFNSYYEALGPRHPRPQRGLLTRPTLEDVLAYRHHVDAAMERFFERAGQAGRLAFKDMAELGLHHEQQHQELILTDIKHAFSCNPLLPCYLPAAPIAVKTRPARLGRLCGRHRAHRPFQGWFRLRQ